MGAVTGIWRELVCMCEWMVKGETVDGILGAKVYKAAL
jgi:hypothetical protein